MDAPTAEDVANILVFVVPGFFARVGYLAYFPQRKQEPAYALVVSVAASVPLVALGNLIADSMQLDTTATSAAYALLLVALGTLAGYGAARLRGAGRVRQVLQRAGIPFEPEATVFERTLLKLPYDGSATVTFKDERVLTGNPAVGPEVTEAGELRELYLTNPRWWDDAADDWAAAGAGIVINLEEVVAIELSDDPTH